MTTAAQPTREELEELERRVKALPELQPIGWEWDFAAGRVTMKQKASDLSLYPAAVTLTFETLTLAYYLMLKTSLELSGVMNQLGPVTMKSPPSGGTSDPSRSQHKQ